MVMTAWVKVGFIGLIQVVCTGTVVTALLHN